MSSIVPLLYLCAATSQHHRHTRTIPARYRFTCEAEPPPTESRKRRQPDDPDLEVSAAQRPKIKENGAPNPDTDSWWQEDEAQPSSSNGMKAPTLFRADTANAVSTLCAISRSGRGEKGAANGAVERSPTRGGSVDAPGAGRHPEETAEESSTRVDSRDAAGAGRKRGENIATSGAVEGSSTRVGSLDTAGAGRNRGENIPANGAMEGSSTRGGSLDTAGAVRNRGGGAAQGAAAQEEADDDVVVYGEGTPAAMLDVLQMAVCALCSEPVLDVCVLPCPHSFCRLCWADYVEKEGTT